MNYKVVLEALDEHLLELESKARIEIYACSFLAVESTIRYILKNYSVFNIHHIMSNYVQVKKESE